MLIILSDQNTTMQRLLEKIRLNRGVDYAKAHPYRAAGALGLIVVVVGAILLSQGASTEEPIEEMQRTVSTVNVTDFAEGALGIAYPTASGDAFVVRAEASGRVTSAAKSGLKVAAGTIVAQIENASERAALTQAQGSYDAARASAAQSDISAEDARAALTSAKQDAIADNRAALTAFTNVLYNTVDELFSNPRTSPGVRISSSGQAPRMGEDRKALTQALKDWESDLALLNDGTDSIRIIATLDRSASRISDLSELVNTFITLLTRHLPDDEFTAAEITALATEFAAAQATLNTQAATLEAAKTTLRRAEEDVSSAAIGGTGGEVSAANAQIKQALGGYQAALANYNRTIVRAPFAGTITTQNVKVGDIINVGADVSIIKPDNGVETTRWWHLPLSAVKYTPDNAFVFVVNGDNKIESIMVETGLVTANNIRITGLKGDETIVTDVRGLKTGDQVEVTAE